MVSKTVGIIGEGVNGTPSGFDNNCENLVCKHSWKYDAESGRFICRGCDRTWMSPNDSYEIRHRYEEPKDNLVTKREVLHAESNCLMKVARSTNSSVGSTLYCTLTPCFECAKLMIQAGVARFVYGDWYKTDDGQPIHDGLNLLISAGIETVRVE